MLGFLLHTLLPRILFPGRQFRGVLAGGTSTFNPKDVDSNPGSVLRSYYSKKLCTFT